MKKSFLLAALATVPLLAAAQDKKGLQPIAIAAIKRTAAVDFENEILPILRNNCLACHNRTSAKGELILETPQEILKGGEGGRAVVPGKGAESLLLQLASHQKRPVMPPRDNKVSANPLTSSELGLIKLWIDQGAKGEVRAARPIEWLPLPPGLNPIYSVALTQDGQFAAAGRANQIFLYHIPSGQSAGRLTDPALVKAGIYGKPGAAHRDMVHSLSFSPDGSLLASAGFREVKLWRRTPVAPKASLPLPATNGITAVSADGKFLAAAAADHSIRLIEIANPKNSRALTGHTAAITALQFSPDHAQLLSGSGDKTARTWSLATGQPFAQTTAPAGITSLCWLGAKQFAAATEAGLIQTFALPEAAGAATPGKELKGHTGAITALASVGAAGDQILSGGTDGSVRHWSITTAQALKQFAHGAPVTAVAARPDGKIFASAGTSGAKLWNATDTAVLADLKGTRSARETLATRDRDAAFAKEESGYRKTSVGDSEKARAAAADRLKKAVEAKATAEKQPLAEKAAAAKKTADEKVAAEKAVSDAEAEVKKLTAAAEADEKAAKESAAKLAEAKANPNTPKPELEKLEAAATVRQKAATDARAAADKLAKEKQKPAQDKLAAATKAATDADTEFKKIELPRSQAENEFNLATAADKKSEAAVAAAKLALTASEEAQKKADADLAAAKQSAADAEKAAIHSLAFSADNTMLATGGDDRLVQLWSAENGAPFASMAAHKGTVRSLHFTTEGRLVSAGMEGAANLWEPGAHWQLEHTLGGEASPLFTDRVNAVRFSPDGRFLATGSGEPSRGGEVKIFAVADAKLAHDFKTAHTDSVLALDFSADGRLLASGAADKFVRVFDLTTGKLAKSFEGHTHHVLGVAWRRNGRVLISAGADNELKVWNYETGERAGKIAGFAKEVTAVQFIGSGDQALVCSGDKQVKIVTQAGGNVRTFTGGADFMYASAATPDSRWVVAGGLDSILRVWNGLTGTTVNRFDPPKDQ
jgi:WD40 repeat protein